MARNRTSPLQTELPLTEAALETAKLRLAADGRWRAGGTGSGPRRWRWSWRWSRTNGEPRPTCGSRRELQERLQRDPRLDALLAFRRRGKPVAEALAEVEQRFGEREFSGRVERSAASPRGAHRGGRDPLRVPL